MKCEWLLHDGSLCIGPHYFIDRSTHKTINCEWDKKEYNIRMDAKERTTIGVDYEILP